tara:strand:+ start:461 stop:973 length:513 start_codon:yes stop_codon:yes gene_type:complete
MTMANIASNKWRNLRVHVEEPRFVVVTMTAGKTMVRNHVYSYEDDINQRLNGSLEVFYKGTKTGIDDEHLITPIERKYPFKVYYRKKTGSFTFLGVATDVTLHTRRTHDQPLVIRMVIRNVSKRPVTRYIEGFAKYKHDVMIHAGVLDQEGKMLINMNSKSLVKGFLSTV